MVKNQALAMTAGSLLVCALRYVCHVISGATVWAGLSIPTTAALSYSFIYNATYMIPETIVLTVASLYIGSVIDFRYREPKRIAAAKSEGKSAWMLPVSGMLVSIAVIFDVAEIFEKLQDAETGEFTTANIGDANWLAITIVTAVCFLGAAVLLLMRKISKDITKD
jgi:thiamine transporter